MSHQPIEHIATTEMACHNAEKETHNVKMCDVHEDNGCRRQWRKAQKEAAKKFCPRVSYAYEEPTTTKKKYLTFTLLIAINIGSV